VTSGESAAVNETNATAAAILKLLTPVIAPVHITLALPCGEQKRQNLGPREMLGDYARNLGSSVRGTRAG